MNLLFNNVFISYSREDELIVNAIHLRLINEDLKVFVDKETILPGMNWESFTLNTLLNANFIVIILTKDSIERNGYAMQEIKSSLEMYESDTSARRMIIPVRVGEAKLPEGLGRFQWATCTKEGIEKMVESIKKQQEIWNKEITQPQISYNTGITLRESWPLITLIITLATLLSISLTMTK